MTSYLSYDRTRVANPVVYCTAATATGHQKATALAQEFNPSDVAKMPVFDTIYRHWILNFRSLTMPSRSFILGYFIFVSLPSSVLAVSPNKPPTLAPEMTPGQIVPQPSMRGTPPASGPGGGFQCEKTKSLYHVLGTHHEGDTSVGVCCESCSLVYRNSTCTTMRTLGISVPPPVHGNPGDPRRTRPTEGPDTM
ncbi:hypothetical protein BDY21DRAFT_330250, partial [Lineolata rhizophorae]